MIATSTALTPPPPPRRVRQRYADHGDGIGKVRVAGRVWRVVDVDHAEQAGVYYLDRRVIELDGRLGPGARAELLAAVIETIHATLRGPGFDAREPPPTGPTS